VHHSPNYFNLEIYIGGEGKGKRDLLGVPPKAFVRLPALRGERKEKRGVRK